jgi:hypothetical protein
MARMEHAGRLWWLIVLVDNNANTLQMMANHKWLNKHVDQNWWANYKGVKEGPVKNPFKPKLF